ncbi:MAG: ComEC/Rec2 family competence protein [Ruminococcus flavefaciens]|nr:ComEC/Rec2 family competence protein [Ruminococcus flavefaciens]MCM1229707.1 ComEC/Rec2 family competence protein [Ruminococcus flavefaciens]
MIGASSAYLSGLFFASFFTDKSGIILLITASVIVFLIAKARNFSRFDLYIIIFSFLTAFTVSMTYTLKCSYVTDFAGQTGNFSGRVTDYEVYDGDKANYVLKGRINGNHRAKISLYTSELGAEYGDIVTLKDCVFENIESDYLFNSTDYYKSRHIFIRAYDSGNITVSHTDSARLKKLLASFREGMIDRICLAIGDKSGGFLAGMIFGEKQYLDDNTRTAVYRSGIGHILAVSGLHVSIIAAVIMAVLNKLRVNKFVSFGVVNLLLLLFIALAEYPVSAIRAGLMLDIMYSARLFRRQNDSLNSIAVAALIIGIADPYAVCNSGFIMSLSGTFGVAVFGPFMAENIDSRFVKALVISICTTFAVIPVNLYYFEETSLASPLTNILLVPLCTLAMLLGLIYIITGGILPVLLYTADVMIKLVLSISDVISSVSFLRIPRINGIIPTMFILSGAVIVCIFLFRSSKRLVSVSIAVSVFICSATLAVSGYFRAENMVIAVLGKGNNAVVAVSYKGRTDITDLSGHYRSAEYVRKYLSENGISTVNTLILTSKTASQDITYETELQPFEVSRRFAVNDTDIYNGRLELLVSNGFTADSGDYSTAYHDNILSVYYNQYQVNFAPAKSSIKSSGLNVYYGNITKNTHIYKDSIYLDDMNNFEIILSSDGQYRIRSLYGEN